MLRCEKNNWKKMWLIGEKHKHMLKERTEGKVEIRIIREGILKIWYEGGKSIRACLMESGNNII
jgi:hypothetical protein